MRKGLLHDTLNHQERQTVKLFLFLFYLINISYDASYYYLLPMIIKDPKFGFENYWVGFGDYFVQIVLLVIAIYLLRRNEPEKIKYIFFIAYMLSAVIGEIIIFSDSEAEYTSGNVVELFLVLFSPVFINKTFCWVVSVGTIMKYLVVGVILGNPEVLLPILLVVCLTVIAFILLNRFEGYVQAIRQSYNNQLEEIVKGIIAALELKDPYTRGHSERVAQYANLFARKMEIFSEEELKSYYYACLLHDVGKVHIRDDILMKPSNLTNEEYEIIKKHPIVGAEAVKNIEGLQESIDVIRYHHERWDGKGYPDRLKGEEIPLLARIASIADAFDAMTTDRSYRPALSLDMAYQRILQGKGSQFDPGLIDIFVEVYPSWASHYYAQTKMNIK
ncbi:Cyclic di-GMP phosphodiesterase response regulator RpfG [Chlamydia abortus]|uniref:HD-GYP domain-containing protein n=1 Tax=Paenibacillus residui TaxID=629724 RepID=A0ABW3DIQ0_9BACL|nr:HD-GYP domain-containing protein [Paenibacillus sp. 32O-W]SHE15230.1 Cyclic di-GMP phosphodiesterase response regulator RpfG [Chlamydia abortus]